MVFLRRMTFYEEMLRNWRPRRSGELRRIINFKLLFFGRARAYSHYFLGRVISAPPLNGANVKYFGKDSACPAAEIKWKMTRLRQNVYTRMITAKGLFRTNGVGKMRRIGTTPATTHQRTGATRKNWSNENLCVFQFPLLRYASLFCPFLRECVGERGRFSLL